VPSSPACPPCSCDCPPPLSLKSIAPGELPDPTLLLRSCSCRPLICVGVYATRSSLHTESV
jgi:gamma-tubulin complex component 2